MPLLGSKAASQRATYVALTGAFLGLFAAVTRKGEDPELSPLDVVQLGLATYRLGRMVAYDKVFETYRAPFAETVPDPTGAGDTVEPKPDGPAEAIGELIVCPICVGTWIAAALVYGLELAPRPTRLMLSIMSSIGLGEVLNALTEALSWYGQNAREQAGAQAAVKASHRDLEEP